MRVCLRIEILFLSGMARCGGTSDNPVEKVAIFLPVSNNCEANEATRRDYQCHG